MSASKKTHQSGSSIPWSHDQSHAGLCLAIEGGKVALAVMGRRPDLSCEMDRAEGVLAGLPWDRGGKVVRVSRGKMGKSRGPTRSPLKSYTGITSYFYKSREVVICVVSTTKKDGTQMVLKILQSNFRELRSLTRIQHQTVNINEHLNC